MTCSTLANSSGTRFKSLELFFTFKANSMKYLRYNAFMPYKSLMKNPMLAIGVLMMVIFLFQANKKYNWWESRKQKLMPSSCKAVLVKLDRRIPQNWHTQCEGTSYNNLVVEVNFPVEKSSESEDIKQVRAKLYREMANDLISVAKISPEDNLQNTDIVRLKMIHPKLIINAITEGKYIVKLKTLTDKRLIAEHLKVTVQVQEVPQK